MKEKLTNNLKIVISSKPATDTESNEAIFALFDFLVGTEIKTASIALAQAESKSCVEQTNTVGPNITNKK
jgi:hypothetical protein